MPMMRIDELRDNPYLFLKIPEDKPVPESHLPDLLGRVRGLILRIEQTTQPGQPFSFNELDELRKSLNRVEDAPETANAFTKIGWKKDAT